MTRVVVQRLRGFQQGVQLAGVMGVSYAGAVEFALVLEPAAGAVEAVEPPGHRFPIPLWLPQRRPGRP